MTDTPVPVGMQLLNEILSGGIEAWIPAQPRLRQLESQEQAHFFDLQG